MLFYSASREVVKAIFGGQSLGVVDVLRIFLIPFDYQHGHIIFSVIPFDCSKYSIPDRIGPACAGLFQNLRKPFRTEHA